MDEGLIHRIHKREARKDLGTKIVGRKICSYDLVTSTNDLAHFFAQHHEPEGLVVFAKGQTHGRGRLGNTWVSPQGKGLYFSFILRPKLSLSKAPRVTLMTALAVRRSLADIHIEDVSIKWPNDVLVKNKKICGILTELNVSAKKINYVVIGVGLNVLSELHELPKEATSLKCISLREFDIADLAHIIVKRIDEYYHRLQEDDFATMIDEIKEFSRLVLGGRVRVSWEDKEIEGYAVDFDEDGNLVIRRDNGFLEKISSGHLVLLSHKS